MTGWFSDLFRLGWGALYWNSRKTWHIARGRHRRCPCQAPSDSGRAHETGCEAVLHFRSPGRFRAVCPLLERRADGAWSCSVNSEDVRPFWGRAALLFAGGGLGCALLLALLAFAALRGVGYPISFRQVAWPPAWDEFRSVQARFYLERALEAQAAGRPQESLLALSQAYELDPGNYASGMLLARLWQAAQPLLSDDVFARLHRDHPEQREQTAQAWYRGLLARGDFAACLRVAGERLLHAEPPGPSPAWVQAALFAARRMADPTPFEALQSAPELPPTLRPLFRLERALAREPSAPRARLLVAALEGERDPFVVNHLLSRLLEEGRAELVLAHCERADLPLSDRETVRLRLDALAALGRASARAALFRGVLNRPTHPAVVELLGAHLIAHPERGLLRELADKLAREPLPVGEDGYPHRLAFFVVCGVAGDAELIHAAAREVSAAAKRDFRALDRVAESFITPPAGFRVEQVLPLLHPMPLPISYALFERYSPPRVAAEAP